jgi:potassium-dependent mechanosensitive channel
LLSRWHPWALAIAAVMLCLKVAAAQTPASIDTESARLDQAAAALKVVETALQQGHLQAADLDKLSDAAEPIGGDVESTIDDLTPRLAALKAQLAQLGPAPAPSAPPEAPKIASDRAKRQKAYSDVDALLKRANLLAVQAQQATADIAELRRANLAQSLFERGPSFAAPALWIDAVTAAPHDLESVKDGISSWLGKSAEKLTAWAGFGFAALIAMILGLCWLAVRLGRRVLPRSETRTPNRLQKILAAWRLSLIVSLFPIVAVAGVGAVAAGFGLVGAGPSLPRVIFVGVVRVAVVAGVALGLLAPTRPNWRLLQLDDDTCQRVTHTVFVFAAIVSVTRVIESLTETVGVSSAAQAVLHGLGAILAALVLAAALRIGREPPDEAEEIFGPRVGVAYDWYGLLRTVLWIAVVAIFTAVLVGMMELGRFIVDQIVWLGAVGVLTAMLVVLVDEVTQFGFAPTTRFGRSLMLSTGLRRDSFEQLTILLSAATRVVILIVAALVALAPWGVQSSDISGYLYAAFFGFKVGGVTISLSRIVFALAIFVAGYLATRTAESWLDSAFLPHTHLDQGLRNAVKTSLGYIGRILALGFALAYLGVDFEKLAIVAGALSVGIGFGLQSIVNNFVSGLILLWERVIRVGDWICVGPNEGYVRRINVRSTEIETFDRAAVVIPNSDLVAGVVKNFVRTDRTGRVKITLAVNPAADPEKARDVLLDIARNHKLVLKKPPPQVVFAEITGAAFNFELYCFIADVGILASVKSDLNFEIYRRFTKENLFAAPPPQSVVTLAGLDRFEPLLDKVVTSVKAGWLGKEKERG